MSVSFSQLMQRARREREHVELDVPSDWMQGRSVFGGLQVAIALEAMRTVVPSTALRTLQATFVAPVPEGLVRAHAQVLRRGKSTTHVEARLAQGNETLAIVIGVFGEPRSSKATRVPRRPPIEHAKPVELEFVAERFPSFTQHFAARRLRGAELFSATPDHELIVELDFKDEGPITEAHVIAIADFLPPVALSHLDARAPGSTLTWMLEMLRDDVRHLPLAGWRVDAELIAAQGSYTSQAVTVWAPDATAVALSRQSMLVFG